MTPDVEIEVVEAIPHSSHFSDHRHHAHRGPWLRALVLGASDGLVSTSALMVGISGGTDDLAALRLASVAALVAGSLSMAIGEYVSVASQRDAERADVKTEHKEQLKGPEARARELEELTYIYVERGLDYALAKQVATVLTEKDPVRAHARDELGIDVDELARPAQAAVVSALSFASGGGVPLLSAAFIAAATVRLAVLLSVTVVGLVACGALGARLGGAGMIRGGARVLIGGAVAVAITFGIGKSMSVNVV